MPRKDDYYEVHAAMDTDKDMDEDEDEDEVDEEEEMEEESEEEGEKQVVKGKKGKKGKKEKKRAHQPTGKEVRLCVFNYDLLYYYLITSSSKVNNLEGEARLCGTVYLVTGLMYRVKPGPGNLCTDCKSSAIVCCKRAGCGACSIKSLTTIFCGAYIFFSTSPFIVDNADWYHCCQPISPPSF